MGGIEYPSACNNAAFNQSYKTAVKDYVAREGFRELARRYALNIVNARFLWRNRIGAEYIEVEVKAVNKNAEYSWRFKGKIKIKKAVHRRTGHRTVVVIKKNMAKMGGF